MPLGPSVLLAVLTGSEPFALEWDAPGMDCPAKSEVDARVRAWLGDRRLELGAQVRIHATATGWEARLRVQWRDHTDQRVLAGSDCRGVAEAVALLLAVMADPVELAAQTGSRAPVEVPAPPPRLPAASIEGGQVRGVEGSRAIEPVEPEVRAYRRSSAKPEAHESLERGPSVELGALVDRGSLPRLGVGPTIGLAWRRPWLRLLVGGRYLPPRQVLARSPAAAEGRVQLAAMHMGACVRLGGGRVEAPLCAMAEVGATWGTRFGLESERRTIDPWVAPGATGGVVVALGRRWALVARLEAAIPLARARYVDGSLLLHQTAPWVVRGVVGFEFRWRSRIIAMVENA
ncbi:MAG: hypothetical protein AAGF11_33630 [Myxococcota bacterium]